jgi:site-specific DNA recombinase
MTTTRSNAATVAKRLRDQLAKQLATLDLQEDRFLDLVGDPDWPKEKLAVKMRAIRDERARVQARLETTESPIDSGYEVPRDRPAPTGEPLELYCTAKRPARKVLNKAIFGKLFIDADEQGPFVVADELNEPFETMLMGRRESSFSEALEKAERARLTASTSPSEALADLLNAALMAECSSKNAMVEVAGIEPASFGSSPGLLRAQPALLFSAPAVMQASRRRAQPLFDVLTSSAAGPVSLAS